MPAYNPFIDTGQNIEAWDGNSLVTMSTLYNSNDLVGGPYSQNPGPGPMNVMYGQSGNNTNAAGTSDNVAMDVAIIVVLALVAVWALRKSGFGFVVGVGKR